MDSAKARASVERHYEDFEPSTEWVAEESSQTLIVYLPGFRKEQLKVQVTSTSNLKISGERPLGAHKWSRFRKECSIPSDCEINTISARFQEGMLYVKLPKKIPSKETEEVKAAYFQKKDEEVKAPTEAPKPHTQKHTKEPQDKKKGHQGHASDHPQPPASKVKKEDNERSDKINGNTKASDVSQKMQEKQEEKKPEKSSNEATHVSQDSTERREDGLAEAGKLASTSTGSNISKVKLGKYKKTATALVTGLKKPKTLMSLVMAMVFMLYVTNAIRSLFVPKNTIQ